MRVLLGLDVGTGGARAVAIGESGELLGEASASYPLLRPRPGWTEQRPEDWWAASARVLREAAAPYRGAVAALGLTGQMHGAVFLDADHAVIRPALLWNDQRTARQANDVASRVGTQRLVQLVGSPALTGFQAPKIRWLADEEPERYARLAHVLLPKDYIRLRLTGELATDVSDASGTLLLDARVRNWSSEILTALEVDRAWLPRVVEGTERTGGLRAAVAEELGLPAGLPVAGGGGDNAAAAIGLGVAREGLASVSIGTSGVTFAHCDAFVPDASRRIHACCHAIPEAYHLMGVALSAGASLQWWRGIAAADRSFDELLAEAAASPAGARGLLFAPYLSGERTPHGDPSARGTFVGLASHHDRGDMTRAVLEGVAFALRDGLDAMRELGVQPEELRATGGGAQAAIWRAILADMMGVPVRRAATDQGPALGAALLGGVAAGHFADAHEAVTNVALVEALDEPDPAQTARYDQLYATYRSLYPSLRSAMHALAAPET